MTNDSRTPNRKTPFPILTNRQTLQFVTAFIPWRWLLDNQIALLNDSLRDASLRFDLNHFHKSLHDLRLKKQYNLLHDSLTTTLLCPKSESSSRFLSEYETPKYRRYLPELTSWERRWSAPWFESTHQRSARRFPPRYARVRWSVSPSYSFFDLLSKENHQLSHDLFVYALLRHRLRSLHDIDLQSPWRVVHDGTSQSLSWRSSSVHVEALNGSVALVVSSRALSHNDPFKHAASDIPNISYVRQTARLHTAIWSASVLTWRLDDKD